LELCVAASSIFYQVGVSFYDVTTFLRMESQEIEFHSASIDFSYFKRKAADNSERQVAETDL
jgi:hypothetical protein